MYNKEAILIPTTSICEGVLRGAVAHTFEPTLELSLGIHIGKVPANDGSSLEIL